jgi:uncharacterized RDD family membrane protein YckC
MAVDVAGEPKGGGVSPLPREARPFQGHRAGVVTRMVAAVIDALVVGAVLLGGYFAFAGLLFMLDPRSFTLPQSNVILSIAMACAVAEVYLTIGWWLGGRTYGYLVMGLRLLGRSGRPRLRFLAAALRALFCVAFPIGVLWVAVSRDNRSVQDIALGTSVVYDWQPRGHEDHRITQY